MVQPVAVCRSYLYVPAQAGTRLNQAGSRGADAIIVDLEDSVAPNRLQVARGAAAAWLSDRVAHQSGQAWLRVNSGDLGLEDIRHTFRAGLTGVCVAKAASRGQLKRVDEVLSQVELEHGVTVNSTAVMPLIESARGLRDVDEIAQSPRVALLQLGELDLAADLGLTHAGHAEMTTLRLQVVVASVAAGLRPPVAAVSPDYRDLGALFTSTQHLRATGFVGRAAIHPAQLAPIHNAFAVSPQEQEDAREMVRRYEEALALGVGAIVGPDGHMLDEAVVRHSRRTLWLAATSKERTAR